MNEEVIEPHLFTTYCAARTLMSLTELLPKTDIIHEISTLLALQYDILWTLMQSKHYGHENLEIVLDHIEDIEEQILNMGEK